MTKVLRPHPLFQQPSRELSLVLAICADFESEAGDGQPVALP